MVKYLHGMGNLFLYLSLAFRRPIRVIELFLFLSYMHMTPLDEPSSMSSGSAVIFSLIRNLAHLPFLLPYNVQNSETLEY